MQEKKVYLLFSEKLVIELERKVIGKSSITSTRVVVSNRFKKESLVLRKVENLNFKIGVSCPTLSTKFISRFMLAAQDYLQYLYQKQDEAML